MKNEIKQVAMAIHDHTDLLTARQKGTGRDVGVFCSYYISVKPV